MADEAPTDPTASPDAKWPVGGLLENVGVHPRRPWVAVTCTNADAETGAVMVLDVEAGTLRAATTREGFVGFDSTRIVRWHPDGRRLLVNIDTNAIALLRDDAFVGAAHPDETRDTPVGFTWIGDQVFADTGSLFSIADGDARFDFEPVTELQFRRLQTHPDTGAVVGTLDDESIAGFDPIGGRLLFRTPIAFHETSHAAWSQDGRWYARHEGGMTTSPDRIHVFSGEDGAARGVVRASRPQVDRLVWGPDGKLFVLGHTYSDSGPRTNDQALDLVVQGRVVQTIPIAPRRVAFTSFDELGAIAVSPTGDGVALLLDGEEVRLHDVASGRALTSFAAPAPAVPAGLPDWYRNARGEDPHVGAIAWIGPQRLLRIGGHFMSTWSLDGTKLSELVVPTAR